ncbi:protein of unknown function [Ruminococcaceae bacterium BL-6]|nr:protein of unknown function [Ruminococcaceae bacterium BL-6]
MNKILNCLEQRLKWYKKAIALKEDEIPFENNFDWPYGNVENWRGVERELKNTIDMMKHYL